MKKNILIDAFGGDNSPNAVLEGALRAQNELDITVTLVGDKNKLNTPLPIIQADDIFDIHTKPTEITKSGKTTSMAVGLYSLRDGLGDAFVSAGSTGALLAGGTLIVKRAKGVKRPAIATLLPAKKDYIMLIDSGANTECRPEMLLQWAEMGTEYMQRAFGRKSPKIGLVNNGTEDTKGRELEIETYKLLAESGLNFGGNIEAREIPFGEFDVIVTDGFTGNIILKLYEGMGSFFGKELKSILMSNKFAGLMLMKRAKNFQKKMDYTEVGGAVLLGLDKPVIKAHGSSDAKAFFNAIRQAKNCCEVG
ncbi:MAG: phosphate acyltransferase PlsX [Ruminococcus sp.]|jgi:glycerol-3-phosphate acyltransferase PlsX|nr:phosphate acyltransferase PlsX [Ruminococcus sp.]